MIDAILGLFGPLAKPEIVRASRRGWLVWLRMVPAVGAGLAPGVVVVVVVVVGGVVVPVVLVEAAYSPRRPAWSVIAA